jgi:hypothetical protein
LLKCRLGGNVARDIGGAPAGARWGWHEAALFSIKVVAHYETDMGCALPASTLMNGQRRWPNIFD